MVGAEGLLLDRQRAFVERLGLGVLALGVVELGQVVQACGHSGMVLPNIILRNFQRLLRDDERTVVLAHSMELHHFSIERLPFDACTLGRHRHCGEHKEQGGCRNCQYVFHTALFSFLWLMPRVTCGPGWRGPYALCTERDSTDRQVHALASRHREIPRAPSLQHPPNQGRATRAKGRVSCVELPGALV